MLRVRLGFLYGFLFVLLGSGVARADDDAFDSNATFFGDQAGQVSTELGPWSLSLSAGISSAKGADTTIGSPQTFETFPFDAKQFYLSFPPATYSVNSLTNGYSLELAVTRRVLTSWLTFGVQGGVSLGNKQTVANGMIPFESFDASGNLFSEQVLGYDINYNLLVYHVEPILQFGPWIPLGNFSFRPYGTIGAGVDHAEETVTLSVAGADFPLASRSTTAFGLLTGAGVDFRFWQYGSVGAEYQYQQIYASPHNWTLGLPTLKFSYLF